MMTYRTLLLGLALLSPLTAASTGSAAFIAPAGTGEANLHRGPDGTVYLTYSGPAPQPGERALWLATLAPHTRDWSAPRLVTHSAQLMENWADFASLIVASDGALWAQWFQNRPDSSDHGYAGWAARSADGGATWSTPVPLGHEFVSLAPLSGGRVLAVWLESTRPPGASSGHGHTAIPAGGPAQPEMRLMARLLGPAMNTLQDWLVDPDVCTCCQTALAVLPGDRAIVVYRGHTPDEIRDQRISQFTGIGWTPPRPLHADGWKIPACPVNGPAADTLGEQTVISWFTAAEGRARVQAKSSRDGGLTFGPALGLDLGRPIGRIDTVMLADGSAVFSWLEAGTGENAAGLYVRRLFPGGQLSAPRLIAPTSAARASGFARLAARTGPDLPVVISWTETQPARDGAPSRTQVRTMEFPAIELTRGTGNSAASPPATPARAVVRRNAIEFLEVCAAAAP